MDQFLTMASANIFSVCWTRSKTNQPPGERFVLIHGAQNRLQPPRILRVDPRFVLQIRGVIDERNGHKKSLSCSGGKGTQEAQEAQENPPFLVPLVLLVFLSPFDVNMVEDSGGTM